MRILTMCEYWDPDDLGGSGRVSQETALQWVGAGHQVTSLAAGPDDYDVQSWRGVERIQFPYAPQVGLRRSWRGFRRGWRRAWRRGPPDLVVAHQPMVMLWALACSYDFTKRARCVNVFHSPWAEEYLLSHRTGSKATLTKAHLRRFLERRALNAASDIFTLSSFMRQRLQANHPSLQARLHTIPGGVSLDAFPFSPDPAPNRKALGIETDGPLLVTVRRLIPRVGIDNLLRAMSGTLAPLGSARLIVGGRGPMKNELQQLAAELGLGDRVEFRGLVPDDELPVLIGAADLFVMPTRALEGFGLTTVEAMACGTPVAATPVGANPEIVASLDPSLVLPSAEPEGIRAGLADLLADPAKLIELRSRSRDLVESRYTWDRMASAILDCLA